jgi:hypothetical protein
MWKNILLYKPCLKILIENFIRIMDTTLDHKISYYHNVEKIGDLIGRRK